MKLVNGQFLGAKRTSVSAPSPAEIAERAYDRAVNVVRRMSTERFEQLDAVLVRLEEERETELRELRDEVIHPPVVRSKR